MHPVITLTHWSHHLHDSMLIAWHEIDAHIHSRHFWAGVGVTLLIVGFVTLLVMTAMRTPIEPEGFFPYGSSYGPYR